MQLSCRIVHSVAARWRHVGVVFLISEMIGIDFIENKFDDSLLKMYCATVKWPCAVCPSLLQAALGGGRCSHRVLLLFISQMIF